jgi:SGT1 protein
MEEGSLLTEALRQQRQQHQLQQNTTGSLSDGHDFDKNAIALDVFSLKLQDIEGGDRHIQRVLHLAELASRCNKILKSWNAEYKWHFGGDGPAFGAYITDGIPHLRALVRYGPNILDEWVAVDYMMKLSKHMEGTENDVAISCWDVEDGQLILIQTADVLPDWIDEDATDRHRHACWIRHGQVVFLSQPQISLHSALVQLRKSSSHSTTDRAIQGALESWLDNIRTHSRFVQRTALVVPRKVAWLIQRRPDLVHACLQSFCHTMEQPIPQGLGDEFDDWVWTTATLSRTKYAMIRTMESPTWASAEFVPTKLGMEVQRFKRQCAVEALPHVRHALQLGVRLVTGLHFLTRAKNSESSSSPSSLERRIAHWSRMDREHSSGVHAKDSNTNESQSSWLLQALQQGPNHAAYNLEHLLKCPVFPEEYGNLTLLSHPETSLAQQLLLAQKPLSSSPAVEQEFLMPRVEDVDDESWMSLEGSGAASALQGNNTDLNGMLEKFQNFMVQQSSAEGVVSSSSVAAATVSNNTKTVHHRREIRPRIFMNILHSVLKGTNLTFPTTDPYFFQDDYDLMDDDDGEGNENDDGVEDKVIKNLMVRVSLTTQVFVYSWLACASEHCKFYFLLTSRWNFLYLILTNL